MTQLNINASPMGRHMGGLQPKKKKRKKTPMMSQGAQPLGHGARSLPDSPNAIISEIYNSSPQAQITKKKVNDPVQLFVDAMNNANSANEQRYQQSIGLLAGQGQASKSDALRQRNEGFGQDTQSLIDRGLGNTTVLDSSRRRRDEDLQRANQRIDESVADRISGAVERRTDQAPDYGLLTSLLQQQSSATAQNQAQSKKTKSLVMGASGSNSSSGAGGSSSGGGGGGGGGGGSRAQGVQTYRNPNASVPFFSASTYGRAGGPAMVGPQNSGVNIFGPNNAAAAQAARKKKKKGVLTRNW